MAARPRNETRLQEDFQSSKIVAMDPATAGLIGAGIGGAVSITTALLAPWVSSRFAAQQFAREAEQEKRKSLEAVLDQAALALEEVHWSILHALTVFRQPDSSSQQEDNWRAARGRMEDARAEASRQGTRLAVRLGGPTDNIHSHCVAAYDGLQKEYRQLVDEVMDSSPGGKLNTTEIEQQLNALGADQTYHNAASALLVPSTMDKARPASTTGPGRRS
jgi:hypothetical protein